MQYSGDAPKGILYSLYLRQRMTREVTVQYKLTPAEQQTASAGLILLTQGEPTSPWMTPVILVFLGLAILVVLYFQSGGLDPAMVGVWVVTMCLARAGTHWLSRRNEDLPEQDMYYRFTDEWIEHRSEMGESRTRWAFVERAAKLPQGYILFLANGVFYWVPRHSVSAADQRTLDQLLTENVSAVTELTATERNC